MSIYKAFASLSLVSMCAALAPAALAVTVTFGFERDVDQRIVALVPSDTNEPPSMFVTKTYLEQRKARVNPERSKSITYAIRAIAGGGSTEIFTFRAEDSSDIGSAGKVADGYVVPVILDGRRVRLYEFASDRGTAEPMEPPNQEPPRENVSRAFALGSGYLEVSSIGDAVSASFRNYSGSASLVVDLDSGAGRIIAVDDVLEVDGNIYILLTSADGQHTLSVRLFRFDSQFTKASRTESRLMTGDFASVKSRFVGATHALPSVQITSRKSLHEPSSVQLVRLDATQSLVKRFEFTTIGGGDKLAIAGICKDMYVFARIIIPENAVATNIEYGIMDSVGAVKRTWSEEIVVGGSVVDVKLAPAVGAFFSLVNFSKLEDSRRSDGWYSWLGYRVDRFDITKDCASL